MKGGVYRMLTEKLRQKKYAGISHFQENVAYYTNNQRIKLKT